MIPKFRAWDKENEKMLEVANISFDKEAYGYDLITIDKAKESPMLWTFNRLEDFALMQFTGLKDKNGVEIFEGDIVKIDDYFNGKMKAKVVFELGAFGFVGIDKSIVDVIPDSWNDDFLTMAYFNWIYDHYEGHLVNVLKIGTVYENPELLEVAE